MDENDTPATESHRSESGEPAPEGSGAMPDVPQAGVGGPRAWSALLLIAVAAIAIYAFLTPHASRTPLKGAADRPAMTEFVARDLDGKAWSLADQKGKVVLVNYWATWCPPCRAELPELANVARQYSGRPFAMVGISVDEGGPEAVRKLVTAEGLPYPILLPAADSAIISSLDAIPTTLLIDRHGRIANRYRGAVTESILKPDIEALLKES
jgi:cytochrome c biogenesis protein CcmG, thiol:disulfide interchange protein DsbE